MFPLDTGYNCLDVLYQNITRSRHPKDPQMVVEFIGNFLIITITQNIFNSYVPMSPTIQLGRGHYEGALFVGDPGLFDPG